MERACHSPVSDRDVRLPSRRAADGGGSGEGRSEVHGEGSRPQRTAPLSRLQEEGTRGGRGEVAGAGRVALSWARIPRCPRLDAAPWRKERHRTGESSDLRGAHDLVGQGLAAATA
jgi:hypothetical protein